jgi:hypothetical protein
VKYMATGKCQQRTGIQSIVTMRTREIHQERTIKESLHEKMRKENVNV